MRPIKAISGILESSRADPSIRQSTVVWETINLSPLSKTGQERSAACNPALALDPEFQKRVQPSKLTIWPLLESPSQAISISTIIAIKILNSARQRASRKTKDTSFYYLRDPERWSRRSQKETTLKIRQHELYYSLIHNNNKRARLRTLR